MNEKIVSKASIQFKFSNNLILLADFALQETITDVLNFFKDQIDVVDMSLKDYSFKLTYDYPPKQLCESKKTIYQEKMFPNVLVYVNFTDKNGKDVNDIPLRKECLGLLSNIIS